MQFSESLIVIFFLLGFIIFTEMRNFIERKKLLDRIMSQDYTNYCDNEVKVRKAGIELPTKEKYTSL